MVPPADKSQEHLENLRQAIKSGRSHNPAYYEAAARWDYKTIGGNKYGY